MIVSFPEEERMKTNFIREHLVSSILSLYEENRQLASGGFIYLDSHVDVDGRTKVNRINGKFAYCHEEIVPMSWDRIPGKKLEEIKREMKEGRFYSYKTIDGKGYKVRKKK